MSKHSQRTIRRLAVTNIILGLLSSLLLPAGNGGFSTFAKMGAPNRAPASSDLQGEVAVRQLKAQGLYDSLQAAFAAVRHGRPARELAAARALEPAPPEDTFSQEAKLMPDSTKFGAESSYSFGSSVAISGATAVIGAPFKNAAYVFVRNGTTWSVQQQLTLSGNPITKSLFGYAVAISGNTLVVTAPKEMSINFTGAAYVFSRYHNLWTQTHRLTPAPKLDSNYFGASVAISGDTIVVGATELNHLLVDLGLVSSPPSEQGAVYVFRFAGHLWPPIYLRQKLVASGAVNSAFGRSVAIDGATIVVGAATPYGAEVDLSGAAYVFVRNGGVWSEQQKLTASDGMEGDQFGNSVAVAGDTIVVGAITDDVSPVPMSNNPNTLLKSNQGSAYVFVRSNHFWNEQQKLIANDGGEDDFFGTAVAIAENTIVVGSVRYLSYIQQGAAYVFERSGTTWNQQQKLMASVVVPRILFGYPVAIGADIVLVGSPPETPHGSKGSAYVFVKPQQRSSP